MDCIYCKKVVLANDSYPTKPQAHKRCWKSRTYQLKLKKIYEYMVERNGAKCSCCGYEKYLGALCLHHRDPSEKDPTWNKQWAKDKLYKELDKCDILCMNCHAETHAKMAEYNHWDLMLKDLPL
jgi:hypothetical protein